MLHSNSRTHIVSFVNSSIRIYNKIDNEIKNIKDINLFKSSL